MIHGIDVDRVELAIYKLKNMARTWFDQWKEGRDEDAPHPSCPILKKLSWGVSFPAN